LTSWNFVTSVIAAAAKLVRKSSATRSMTSSRYSEERPTRRSPGEHRPGVRRVGAQARPGSRGRTLPVRAAVLLRADAGERGAAEADLQRALEIAQQQEAPSLDLPAARDLASVLVERGETLQAAGLLATVYERLRHADLKDIKALVDELRAYNQFRNGLLETARYRLESVVSYLASRIRRTLAANVP
jgi:hypothetical protein